MLPDVDDHDRDMAMGEFANQWLALEDLSDSGYTPHYLTGGQIQQDSSMPFPGGYIRALVMSRVPGQSVAQILFDLSKEEQLIVMDQFTSILEWV